MFDEHILRYITSYLRCCTSCNKYDIYCYQQVCCICKLFFCENCKHKLIRNGNHYETTSNYCKKCNEFCFQYVPPKLSQN